MKTYEVVHERFSHCPGDQMRDTSINEVAIEDFGEYIQSQHKEKKLEFQIENLENGAVVYHVEVAGTFEKYTFTEI